MLRLWFKFDQEAIAKKMYSMFTKSQEMQSMSSTVFANRNGFK